MKPMIYCRPHPEARKDEACIMNVSKRFYETMGWWNTKRMGTTAFSKNGMAHTEQKDIAGKFFPVFVSKKEIERFGYRPVPVPYEIEYQPEKKIFGVFFPADEEIIRHMGKRPISFVPFEEDERG